MTISEIESTYSDPGDFIGHVRAYWVPIELRETVLSLYRQAGIRIRIRFRGSRKASVGREMPCIGSDRTYRRRRNQANQDCLLADATHFTVYMRP
jgi:hypothetical protein